MNFFNKFFEKSCDLKDLQFVHFSYCILILFQLLLTAKDQFYYYSIVSSYPPELIWPTPEILGWFEMPILTFFQVKLVFGFLIVSLFLTVLGYKTRLFMILSAIFSMIYFNQLAWFGLFRSTINLPLMLFILLSAAPDINKCGFLYWYKKTRKTSAPELVEHWPIKMGQISIASMYFAAGYSKLVTSGLHWVNAENLQTTILSQFVNGSGNLPMKLGLFIAHNEWICWFMVISVIIWEILFPFILWTKRIIWGFVIFGFCFNLAVNYMMQITFFRFSLPAYVFFLSFTQIQYFLLKYQKHKTTTQ